MRVLLVEDDPDQAAVRRMILETAGYDVLESSCPAEALSQIEFGRPHAVVMDLRLPREEDGLDLVKRIAPAAPVIVLSGGCQLHSLPIFRFLKKPCRSEELLRAIDEAVTQNGPAS